MTEDNTNLWAKTADGISLGARYLLNVRAFNADGEVSNWSDDNDFTAAYTEVAPTGLSIELSNDWDGNASSSFEITAETSCTDLNVATMAIDISFDGGSSWQSMRSQTYVDPYESFVGTKTTTAPNYSESLTYHVRVLAYNSTGEVTSATDAFSITSPPEPGP